MVARECLIESHLHINNSSFPLPSPSDQLIIFHDFLGLPPELRCVMVSVLQWKIKLEILFQFLSRVRGCNSINFSISKRSRCDWETKEERQSIKVKKELKLRRLAGLESDNKAEFMCEFYDAFAVVIWHFPRVWHDRIAPQQHSSDLLARHMFS